MHALRFATLLLVVTAQSAGRAQSHEASQPAAPGPNFDVVATEALAAMSTRADQLHVSGAAVVATFTGDTITSWRSQMAVVGRYKDDPKGDNKGSNLIAVVYSKAAEMADTHRNSGSAGRPPLTGETGWSGGVIAKTRSGYVIAAFSGGQSEDDVKVSEAGLDKLKAAL